MYRLLSSGLIGDPCGVPRPSSRLCVLRRWFPRSSVSSTGASSHILIRCSIAPSTTLRATDLISSAWGTLSKETTTHYTLHTTHYTLHTTHYPPSAPS